MNFIQKTKKKQKKLSTSVRELLGDQSWKKKRNKKTVVNSFMFILNTASIQHIFLNSDHLQITLFYVFIYLFIFFFFFFCRFCLTTNPLYLNTTVGGYSSLCRCCCFTWSKVLFAIFFSFFFSSFFFVIKRVARLFFILHYHFCPINSFCSKFFSSDDICLE